MAAACAVALTTPVHALEYSYRIIDQNKIVVDAAGDFLPEENKNFNAWMEHLNFELVLPDQMPPTTGPWATLTAVVFNSGGGAVSGGFAWADYIDRHGINTGVMAGGRCASACVTAWSSGKFKSATTGASIGVHSVVYEGSSLTPDKKVDTEKKFNDMTADWLLKHHAPVAVITAMRATSSENIHWLTEAELRSWSVNIVEPDEPPTSAAAKPVVPAPPADKPLISPNAISWDSVFRVKI
jgi:hypothetical protein